MPLRAAALWLLLPLVALGEVKIEIQPGLTGVVRARRWGFLSVTLTNDEDDASGEVQVTLPGDPFSYTRKLDLPAKTRKRVNVYFRMRDIQTEVEVKWVPTTGEEIKKPEKLPAGNREPYYVVGLWSTTQPSQSGIGLEKFISPAVLATDDLPDHWKGFDALDVLVIDAPEVASISPSQVKALSDWVEGGGHIVIVGDATWQPTSVDPVIAALMPCKVIDGTVGSVDPGDLSGARHNPVSVLKVQLNPFAFTIAEEPKTKTPLCVREFRGRGIVDFLTCHPRQLTPSGKDLGPIWGFLLINKPNLPKDQDPRAQTESFIPILVEPKAAGDTGSTFGVVTLFALIYAVLVGPGVFWLQRRYRNVFTRALTFPAVVAGFVVVAWLLNAVMKERTMQSRRINLVYGRADGKGASGTTYFSFISPYEGNFQITSRHEGALFASLPRGASAFGAQPVRFSEVKIVEGATHQVALSVRPYIPETFVCEWKGDVDTGIVPALHWVNAGAGTWRIEGTIENTMSTDLTDCRLIWKGTGMGTVTFVGPFPGKTTTKVYAGLGESPDAVYKDFYRLNPLLEDDTATTNRWNTSAAASLYLFYAICPLLDKPFKEDPKQPKTYYGVATPPDREYDTAPYSVMPMVLGPPASSKGQVVLIGWRDEGEDDVSQLDLGRVSSKTRTMYALRLEVAGGR